MQQHIVWINTPLNINWSVLRNINEIRFELHAKTLYEIIKLPFAISWSNIINIHFDIFVPVQPIFIADKYVWFNSQCFYKILTSLHFTSSSFSPQYLPVVFRTKRVSTLNEYTMESRHLEYAFREAFIKFICFNVLKINFQFINFSETFTCRNELLFLILIDERQSYTWLEYPKLSCFLASWKSTLSCSPFFKSRIFVTSEICKEKRFLLINLWHGMFKKMLRLTVLL